MYVQNFSRIAKPLNTLLKKNVVFEWKSQHDYAVELIKAKLKENLKLGHFHSECDTFVTVDASYKGLGAVLTQQQSAKQVTIMFASRSLNEREEKLHSNDLEMMAVHWAVTEKFRIYLYGLQKPFIVLTDNWTVTCLMDRHLMNRKFARWIIDLQEYRFEVKHKPGKTNQIADGLSRSISVITGPNAERFAYVILRAQNQKLVESQANDKFCTEVIENLDSNLSFEIVEGVLTRIVDIRNKKFNRVVVPTELRKCLLKQHHDNEGHMNADRTTSKIARNYWWPKMYNEIYSYVKSCESCQRSNSRTTKRYGLMQKWEIPKIAFEVISLDYIGPLQRFQGYTHILVSVDHATRYVNAKPQRNPTTNQVVGFLREEIIYRHRTPSKMMSDNAKPFVSNKMVEFLKEHNIEQVNSPPYWAESNGLIERTVGVVTRALRKSLNNEARWKEKLCEIIYGINTSRHSSLRMTPYELIYNQEAITKAEIEIGYIEYDQDTSENVKKMEEAHQNLKDSQKKMKEHYDTSKQAHNFQLGEKVLLEKETRGKKLENLYNGPYRISKRISENIFEVDAMDDINEPRRIVPAQRLKRYHERKMD